MEACPPGSEPAASSKHHEQDQHGQDLGSEPEGDEGSPPSDVANEEGEVLPEEARQPAERKEDRGDYCQLLHHYVQPVRDRREVDVQGSGQKVSVRVDEIADPDQVIVDIAKVALVLLAHPRQATGPAHKAREQV